MIDFLQSLFSAGLSLLGISFIITFHEFGHFLFAKLFKIYTPTFSFGMGKKLFSYKIKETEFCISALPMGGYVEIAESTNEPGYKGFNDLYYWQKVLIMLGGIAFNILFSYIALSLLFATHIPKNSTLPARLTTARIEKVASNSANANSLHPGDTIVEIENTSICNECEVLQNTLKNSRKKIVKAVIQDQHGNTKTIPLTINTERSPSAQLMLDVLLTKKEPQSMLQAVQYGIWLTHYYITMVAKQIGSLFSFSTTSGKFAGPILTLVESTKHAKKGTGSLLFLLALISINLGIMNLLPIPIFDGGQFVIFTIESILGKSLPDKVRHYVGVSCWTIFIALFIILSVSDLRQLQLLPF